MTPSRAGRLARGCRPASSPARRAPHNREWPSRAAAGGPGRRKLAAGPVGGAAAERRRLCRPAREARCGGRGRRTGCRSRRGEAGQLDQARPPGSGGCERRGGEEARERHWQEQLTGGARMWVFAVRCQFTCDLSYRDGD